MLDTFYATLEQSSPVAVIIITISLMLFVGFLMTRITKLFKLPNVTAYIIAGILMGPYCFNLIPLKVIDGMDFISDIALAFIAFGVGEFFKISTLKKNGAKVLVITVAEACLASVVVFVLLYWIFGLSLGFSIVLAALASATAPASTLMTIRQTGAHGDFVDTLLQVVALDDVVSLVAYSIAISVALSTMGGKGGGFDPAVMLLPLAKNLGVLLLGGVFGYILKLLFHKRSTDNRLIVSIAVLFAFCGICAVLGVSPLLGCMSMGMVYINLTDDVKLFQQLNYFSPPILLLFFVHSGLGFKLDALVSVSEAIGGMPLMVIGAGYFVARIVGKYFGAFLGCLAVGKPKAVRNYLGMALVPQAGVAIGLAALGARTLGGAVGSDLETIILASSVLYEIVGPACAKLSLFLSGSYNTKNQTAVSDEITVPEKSAVDLLIEEIQRVQKTMPGHDPIEMSPDEIAFTEAAEEQYQLAHSVQQKHFKNAKMI